MNIYMSLYIDYWKSMLFLEAEGSIDIGFVLLLSFCHIEYWRRTILEPFAAP